MSSPYLLNCWYIAAWTNELKPGAHKRRVLLGKPVLLMRSADGRVAAMSNVCPHRFASLSEGRFETDQVECPYHGLRFDMDGRCVRNPHGDGRIPHRARVPVYPSIERHGAIWIWTGPGDAADPTLIPDLSFLDSPSISERPGGYLHTKANYRLLCDNILDLSHADFLHRTTLGADGEIARTIAETHRDGDVVTIKWAFDGKGSVINRGPDPVNMHTTFEVTWYAPSAMILRAKFYPIGDEASMRGRVAAHIMTPETERTSHYFFNVTDGSLIERVGRVFETEDGVMLEEVQRNMGDADFWDMASVILSSDSGAVLVRRILERKIRDEQRTITVPS